LRGADLRETDLREAVLREAIADLTTWWPDEHSDPTAAGVYVQPTLENADLRSAYLRNRDLTGISLRGARANAFTEWPDGFDWQKAGVIMDDEPRPSEDCRHLPRYTHVELVCLMAVIHGCTGWK
jgi:hypothetical protein